MLRRVSYFLTLNTHNILIANGISSIVANRGVQSIKMDIHHDKITHWLSPSDPSTNFNKARKQRYGKTSQWLLDGDLYSTWKTNPNSFLWLNGIPGCGKTILSSTVIVDLQSIERPIALLYFHFDFNDTNKQSLENAIRSFINQLYHQKGECRAEVDSLHSSCQEGQIQPDDITLLTLLQELIQNVGEV